MNSLLYFPRRMLGSLGMQVLIIVVVVGAFITVKFWSENRLPYEWEIRNKQLTQHPSQTEEEDPASSGAKASRISQTELQQIIADVYHVETSRFIQPDLLWITLPADAPVQKTCQAIANVWAVRSGLDYVRVESWNGSKRLGQGTVYNGQVQTP